LPSVLGSPEGGAPLLAFNGKFTELWRFIADSGALAALLASVAGCVFDLCGILKLLMDILGPRGKMLAAVLGFSLFVDKFARAVSLDAPKVHGGVTDFLPVMVDMSWARLALDLASASEPLGVVGAGIWRMDGLPSRGAIAAFANNTDALVRTPAIDAACLAYIGVAPEFYYCRYHDAGAPLTVALIGDSHAHVTFPGMAEAVAARGYNLVMLANTGCPPLLGTVTGATAAARERCAAQIDQMLETVSRKTDIVQVFMTTRGPFYITGDGFGEAERHHRDQPIQAKDGHAVDSTAALFGDGLLATTTRLQNAGKNVAYILENPELGIDVSQCIIRPLRSETGDCSLPLATVMARQAEYRKIVNAIPGLTVIDPLPAFCTGGECRALDGTHLLYADDNHLSVAGSRFLTRKVLRKYLPDAAQEPAKTLRIHQ
jgi:hypothetical protein